MAGAPDTDLFRMQPLHVEDGIPVFCHYDDYLGNYDRIAEDHLNTLATEGTNPFMAPDTVDALELRTVDFARSHHPEIGRILDAGVGPGTFLSRVPAREKHGVDVSMGYLRRVKEMGIAPVLSKLEQLPYADNSFDMVISTDVLEHVLDFLKATIQLVRVLDEGGTLVIRVPYRENLSAYLALEDYDLVHVRTFDIPSLRVHFEKVLGLEFLGSELLQPHWRGVGLGLFEDAIDRQLSTQDLEALDTVPGLQGFSKIYRALPAELDLQVQTLRVTDPETYQRVTQALSRHLTVSVAFRKPARYRFRESLSHLVDPGQTDAAPMATHGLTHEGHLLAYRLAAIEAKIGAGNSQGRIQKLENRLAELEQTVERTWGTHQTVLAELQDATASLVLQQKRLIELNTPEPPRSLKKRLSINGLRRLLGL